MLYRPKIGDTVIFKAIVVSVDDGVYTDSLKVNFIDCENPGVFTNVLWSNRVHSVIQRSLQVGDKVHLETSNLPHDLLLIHGDPLKPERLWGVVAYKGDLPRTFKLRDLRRAD